MSEAADGEIVVKRHPEVVSEVRRFVRLTVGRWGVDDYVPCLVASELVTNALRYGTRSGDHVVVRLGRLDEGTVWLEVQDMVSDLPWVLHDADMASESGRGLVIVERLSVHWGIRPLAGGVGKVVFALIDP